MDREEKLEIIKKFIELLNNCGVEGWDKVAEYLKNDNGAGDTVDETVIKVLELMEASYD